MAASKGNKYALGAKSGRKKLFKSDKELQAAIDAYFSKADELGEPYTVEGLCLALDVDRKTLLNYQKEEGYEEYFHTIKKAKLKVQDNLIKRGLAGVNNSTLTIFLLKNNHEYADKIETENLTTVKAHFTISEMQADKNTFASNENEVE